MTLFTAIHPLFPQVSAYDDVGGEVADIAREAALSAMASAHVVVLVLDVAMALKSQKVCAWYGHGTHSSDSEYMPRAWRVQGMLSLLALSSGAEACRRVVHAEKVRDVVGEQLEM
eukprot:570840-Pelagomonas_calceolata.AAC.8